MIAYLERKQATCHTKTVSAMATRLKHFGVFLAEVDPDLATVTDLDRRRHIEPYLASLLDAVSEQGRRADQPSATVTVGCWP